MWPIVFIVVAVLGYFLIDEHLTRKHEESSKEKEKREKEKVPGYQQDLPDGWSLEYNPVANRYRWRDEKGNATAFPSDTKEECIRGAWEQLEHRRKNAEGNWQKFK